MNKLIKSVLSNRKGIKIPFNPLNKYGDEPCCCQKGYYTKFGSSTVFCAVCNLFCLRRLTKTSSFCRKYGWASTCTTCQQYGDYKLFGKGICNGDKDEETTKIL